jgi:hypothetical protein
MSAAAILAIVVATGEVQDPATAAMLGAAQEALGRDVIVRLVGVRQPDQVDPLRIERELSASAVVAVVWRDADRRRARLRLHLAAGDRSTTRDVDFSPADTQAERGRTLGLAAASMWPEIVSVGRAAASARPPPAATGAKPPLPAAAPPGASREPVTEPTRTTVASGQRAGIDARPEAPAPPAAPAEERAPPSTARRDVKLGGDALRARRFAIGIAGIGAIGVGGPAAGLGGRLEGTLSVANHWSLRLGLSARTGSIPALPGTDLVSALAGGVEWWPGSQSGARMARLGVRADAMALSHRVSGARVGGQAEEHARLVPGLDLLAQVALRVAARIDLMVAAGAEAALGKTEVRTGATLATVATIPPIRLTAELGLRVGF